MIKVMITAMIIIWVALICITGVNMYNQYLVNKQNVRLIKAYQMKSTYSPAYTDIHDSLNKEIANAESLSTALLKPFPLKNLKTNWLFLRLAIVFMSIASGIILWIYRRTKAAS